VLVGFSSLREMTARVRDKSLSDAMITYAESAIHLPYNPAQEVWIVIGVANAAKNRMETCVYENTLDFRCPKCSKIAVLI
jgi:hypothetical protein